MNEYTGKLRNMASVYLCRDEEILLLYRQGSSIVSNLWIGSAGGHFEQSELNDAKSCVLRELKEELDLNPSDISNVQLRYVTLRYADGEIRQNYYFFAELSKAFDVVPASTEGLCRWFHLSQILELPMPFTARHMIDHYLTEGRYTDKLYGGIANNAGVTFLSL